MLLLKYEKSRLYRRDNRVDARRVARRNTTGPRQLDGWVEPTIWYNLRNPRRNNSLQNRQQSVNQITLLQPKEAIDIWASETMDFYHIRSLRFQP